MNFDPNMINMAMAMASTMMQFLQHWSGASPLPADDAQAQAGHGKKGKKGRKLRALGSTPPKNETSLVASGQAGQGGQSPADASGEMHFTGQSLQEHCANNPCYLCNDFEFPHAARHHNIKKWPPELTARYNTNRENWLAIKGAVQRGMPDKYIEQKNFLVQRLSVKHTAPFLHLHGRAFVSALLNTASGLPPFPSLRSQQAAAPLADIPVAPVVAPSAVQTGGFPFAAPARPFTAPASPFVFGSNDNGTVASAALPADGDTASAVRKKKGRKKRQHTGEDVPSEVAAPAVTTTLTHTSATSTLPVATFSTTAPMQRTFFTGPAFSVGQSVTPQQLDVQRRLQVQESITTLQEGQMSLDKSVTSLQVKSSVSTHMVSLQLLNQGWSEEQIEEKIKAEREKQMAALVAKRATTTIRTSAAGAGGLRDNLTLLPAEASPAKYDGTGLLNDDPDKVEAMNVDAPEVTDEGGDSAGSQNVVDAEDQASLAQPEGGTVDGQGPEPQEPEKEPRPCPEDSRLQGRKSLGSLRISDMVQDMYTKLVDQNNHVTLPTFSRRLDAIHYLSHVTDEGLFAVTQSSTSDDETPEFTVKQVRSLLIGLAGPGDKAPRYQENTARSPNLDSKAPQAPIMPEGTVVWQLPDYMLFLRSDDAAFKALTLTPPHKRTKTARPSRKSPRELPPG